MKHCGHEADRLIGGSNALPVHWCHACGRVRLPDGEEMQPYKAQAAHAALKDVVEMVESIRGAMLP